MKLPAKILLLTVVLASLFLISFVWLGDATETMFARDPLATDMTSMKAVGWLLGLGLLVVDILLPVPATGVMSALGMVYGFWLGWLISAAGSTLSGVVGYGLARAGGNRIATKLAKPQELVEFRDLFDRWGWLTIIGSRGLPILPEVMAVLAGLARMRFRLFLAALLAGTIPVSGLFAWWGHYTGANAPATSLLVAIFGPLLVWALFVLIFRRRCRSQTAGCRTPTLDTDSNCTPSTTGTPPSNHPDSVRTSHGKRGNEELLTGD